MITTILAADNYVAHPDAVCLGVLVVRVCAGVALATHGYQKYFKGGRIAGTGRWFESIGIRHGRMNAYLAATTEISAGLLFALGALTPLAAMGMFAMMCVAGYTAHWRLGKGFMSVNDGIELNFVYGVVAAGVATIGAGRYSVDYSLELIEQFDGWTGLVIAAGGGVIAALAQMAIFYRPPAD